MTYQINAEVNIGLNTGGFKAGLAALKSETEGYISKFKSSVASTQETTKGGQPKYTPQEQASRLYVAGETLTKQRRQLEERITGDQASGKLSAGEASSLRAALTKKFQELDKEIAESIKQVLHGTGSSLVKRDLETGKFALTTQQQVRAGTRGLIAGEGGVPARPTAGGVVGGGVLEEAEVSAAEILRKRTQAALLEAEVIELSTKGDRENLTANLLLAEQKAEYAAQLRKEIAASEAHAKSSGAGLVAGTQIKTATLGQAAEQGLAKAQTEQLKTQLSINIDKQKELLGDNELLALQAEQKRLQAEINARTAVPKPVPPPKPPPPPKVEKTVDEKAAERVAKEQEKAAILISGSAQGLANAQAQAATATRLGAAEMKTEALRTGELAEAQAADAKATLLAENEKKRLLLVDKEYVQAQQEALRLGKQLRGGPTPPPAPGGGSLGELLGGRLITGATFAASAISFRQIYTSVKSLISAAEDLQLAFTRIRTQMEAMDQAGDFPVFRENILAISRDTGLAGDALAAVAQQALGVYQNVAKATDAVRAAGELAVVTGQDPAQVFKDLNPAAVAFGTTMDALSDKVVGIGQRFGSSAKESEDFFGRVGVLAAESGLSLEQTAAFAGVIQQKLTIGGTQAGELFNRVLSGISEKSAKLLEVYRTNAALQQRLPNLEAAIATGDEGKVLIELTNAYQGLDPVAKTAILNTIAGKRERAEFTAVLEGGQAALAKEAAGQSDAGKRAKAFADAQATLRVEVGRVGQSLKQLGDNLARSGVFDAFGIFIKDIELVLDALRALTGMFASLNEKSHGIVGFLGAIAAAFVALKLAISAVEAVAKSEALVGLLARLPLGAGFAAGLSGGLGGGAGGGGGGGGGGDLGGGLLGLSFLRRRRLAAPRVPTVGPEYGPPAPIVTAEGEVVAGELAAVEAPVAEAATGLGATLGGGAASILGSPLLIPAIIGAGILKVGLDKVAARDKKDIATLTALLATGQEADRARVEALAQHRSTAGEKIISGLEHPFQTLFGDERFTVEAQAQKALQLKQLQDEASSVQAGLDAGIKLRLIDVKEHFKNEAGYKEFLAKLAAGDPDARHQADELLAAVYAAAQAPAGEAAGLPEAYNLAFQVSLKGNVTEVAKNVQLQTDAITNAQKSYEAGSISRTTFIKVITDALKVQDDAIAAAVATGGTVPADVQALRDADAKLKQDEEAALRADQLSLEVAKAGVAKSKTRDPVLKQQQDAKIAALNRQAAQDELTRNQLATATVDPALQSALDRAKAARNNLDAVSPSANIPGGGVLGDAWGPPLSPEAHAKAVVAADKAVKDAQDAVNAYKKAHPGEGDAGLAAKLETAKAQQEDVAAAGVDLANQIAAAKIKYARVQIGTSANVLEDAKTQKALADEATRTAVGDIAKLDALTAEAQADKSLADAQVRIKESQIGLLIATANAAGDQVKAARLSAQEVQAELDRAQNTPGTGEEVINDLKSKLVTSQDAAAAARVAHTRELIDFQLQMNQITVGQAIAQMQALLASPDVQKNQDRVRQLQLAIKGLQNQVSSNLQFNIGDLKLPTLYEANRLGATAAAGTGYNDNRQISIVMHNYNATDYQGSIDQFVDLAHQPSRYGTYASIYPTRN